MASKEFEDIVSDFEVLEDWEDKYRYIIDLGKKLKPIEDSLKNETTKISGCASQVWITHYFVGNGEAKSIFLKGDSDALIVKGLIAIILSLFNGVRINDSSNIDTTLELKRLGLNEHLSSQRANGLRSMIARINAITAT